MSQVSHDKYAISETETGAEDINDDTSSLADIMMAEKTNIKKNSDPIGIRDKKNLAGTNVQNK